MIETEESLAHLLADLEWQVDIATSEPLPLGTAIPLPRAHSLSYVVSGSVEVIDGVRHDTVAIDPSGTAFVPGDFIFSAGASALSIRAVSDARVVVVRLIPRSSSAAFTALPAALTVRGFATTEPIIAQLAAAMGCSHEVSRASDSLVCSRVATTVMSAAIRTWVDRGCAPVEFFRKAADPYLSRAVDAIHADPSHPWSVGELAAAATMSRSVFAERFRESLGLSPASYLTAVRMSVAQRHLGNSTLSVAEIAGRTGYASEDGFSRAFRRRTGLTPTAWRFDQRLVAS